MVDNVIDHSIVAFEICLSLLILLPLLLEVLQLLFWRLWSYVLYVINWMNWSNLRCNCCSPCYIFLLYYIKTASNFVLSSSAVLSCCKVSCAPSLILSYNLAQLINSLTVESPVQHGFSKYRRKESWEYCWF